MKRIIAAIVFMNIAIPHSWAFSVSRDPFLPLVKTQSMNSSQSALSSQSASSTNQESNFTLQMVMWGDLKGALLKSDSGMVYVVKEGTKIGPTQILRIMPNKVIMKTPNGIKELSLKSQNNVVVPQINSNKPNQSIQNIQNKTLTNEVKP